MGRDLLHSYSGHSYKHWHTHTHTHTHMLPYTHTHSVSHTHLPTYSLIYIYTYSNVKAHICHQPTPVMFVFDSVENVLTLVSTAVSSPLIAIHAQPMKVGVEPDCSCRQHKHPQTLSLKTFDGFTHIQSFSSNKTCLATCLGLSYGGHPVRRPSLPLITHSR
jgi:hypothetical protein